MQLPIALVLLVVCLPVYVAGVIEPSTDAAPGWIGLAMAGPFALSGLMLRASSSWQIYWDGPAGSGPVTRTIALIATVSGIAALSIALTVVAAYVLFFLAAALAQMT